MFGQETCSTPASSPLSGVSIQGDTWVADLHSALAPGECQSTVGFDDHECDGAPRYYVELQMVNYNLEKARWEGKLCSPCLAGWAQWVEEEPESVQVVSVNPIILDN